jgi:chromosome partitioning protein
MAKKQAIKEATQQDTRVLALLAQKGGAGKSTLALHLAVLAQQEGRRTLLVDLDPQRSTAGWWRARTADTPELVETEPDRLAEVVAAARADGVALVVVDTRPSAERDAVTVARQASLSLIPTRPSILDLRAIGATAELVRETRRPGGIVLNACPPGRGGLLAPIVNEAKAGLADYGLPVVPVAIHQRADLAHALIDGRAVSEFAPNGKASLELKKLWRWAKERME